MKSIKNRIRRWLTGIVQEAVQAELANFEPNTDRLYRDITSTVKQNVHERIILERKAMHWIVQNELKWSQNNIHFEDLRAVMHDSRKYAKQHFRDIKEFHTREEMWQFLFSDIQRIPGLNLEFGVWQGKSLSAFATAAPDIMFYGFDSFEGLPEFWKTGSEAGRFATKPPGNLPENITLVQGLFEDTLPQFTHEHQQPVSFLHIDCDLYSSTKCVFDNLGDLIGPGTVILFDEYYNYPGWEDGEFLAFHEFIEKYQLKYNYIAYNSYVTQVAIQIR